MLKQCVIGLVAVLSWPAFGQYLPPECGQLENAYGPYDYTNPSHFREKLPRVERAHFDAGVESLRGHAAKPTQLVGDLDYTLRAFPNHARALQSIARYALTAKAAGRAPLRYTADCYFRRALTFKPADAVVHSIYAVYLFKAGQNDKSAEMFQRALEIAPRNPEIHYNYGLLLVKGGDLETARHHAGIAYELGHPLPGLRNKLQRANAW